MRWWSRLVRWMRVDAPPAGDLVLAGVVTALAVAQLAQPVAAAGRGAVDVVGVVLPVALCAPLAVRSRAARLALLAMTAGAAGGGRRGGPRGGRGGPRRGGGGAGGARRGVR